MLYLPFLMHAQPVPLPLPQVMQTHAFRPQHVLSGACQWRGEEKTLTSLIRGCCRSVPFSAILFALSLELTFLTKMDSQMLSEEKDQTQYLSVEQMVENDYAVPSYLVDVFSKPDE